MLQSLEIKKEQADAIHQGFIGLPDFHGPALIGNRGSGPHGHAVVSSRLGLISAADVKSLSSMLGRLGPDSRFMDGGQSDPSRFICPP